MRRGRWIVIGVAAALLLASCQQIMADDVNQLRTTAGVATLPTSDVLSAAADTHSQAMCSAHSVSGSANPATTYDQESAVAIHELVGSAPLDPDITDGGQRNRAATAAIWAQWQSDPALVAANWSDQGTGESTCSDHRLYMTEVLRQLPTIPAAGLYSTPQYDASTIKSYLGIQYTTAVDYTGTTIPLLLDVYTPPAAAPSPRPTVILIHGGAFVGGSRTDNAGTALGWAERGYDVVAIDYRLDQSLRTDSSPSKQVTAGANATLDGEQSVRWIKANAATYGFDVTRIAANGNSAGGAVALGMAGAPDAQMPSSGPLAGISSKITAAISDGAYLTPALEAGVLHFGSGLAPIQMYHYETDAASNTGPYAFETCAAYRTAGNTCDFISEPGEGHTTDLSAGGYWWTSKLGPFLWQNLHLGS